MVSLPASPVTAPNRALRPPPAVLDHLAVKWAAQIRADHARHLRQVKGIFDQHQAEIAKMGLR